MGLHGRFTGDKLDLERLDSVWGSCYYDWNHNQRSIGVSMDYIKHVETPLGKVLISSDGKALTGLWFEGQKHFGSTLSDECVEKNVGVFDLAERWLDVYFSGDVPDFTPPVAPAGTDFQKYVWALLLKIPYGETVTYGEIAAALAEQRAMGGDSAQAVVHVSARAVGGVSAQALGRVSARAVGGAVGRNPISLIIPCHRVVGARGDLTGYAGGLERKKKLLALEGRQV